MNTYLVGTRVLLAGQFTDSNGNALDPTTVVAKLRTPDGVVSTLTVQRNGVGAFSVSYTPGAIGLHQYRFEGSGAAVAANESQFLANSVF